MGKSIEYVLRIASYFIMLYFIYGQIKLDYKKHEEGIYDSKLSYGKITVMSLVISAWAVFNFNQGTGDHLIYGYYFLFEDYNPVYDHSYGLALIYDFLHIFTYNPYVMFVFVIFLGCFLVLSAYRIDKTIRPEALLILFLSEYFLYSSAAIKQFIATGFAFLFFACFLNGKKKQSIIWMVCAIMFHEVAYILIPIYIGFGFKKNGFLRSVVVIGFLIVFLFPGMLNRVLSSVFPYADNLEKQLESYMDDGTLIQQSNYATILKGLPFYMLCFMPACILDKQRGVIVNYKVGSSLNLIASCFMLASFYNYWYFRFSYLFMLPVFAYIVNAEKATNSPNVKKLNMAAVFIIAALTIKYMFQMFFRYGGI